MTLNEFFSLPPVYTAPTIAAWFYKDRRSGLLDIFLVNLLTGWTYAGWAFAVVMIFVDARNFSSSASTSTSNASLSMPTGPSIPEDHACGACNGHGRQTCQSCNGSRGSTERNEHAAIWVHCTPCGGSGQSTCWACAGTGRQKY